ncbi:uncharacterized protein LOC123555665 [Mercenaria mercenaria]|uniref:uncharacterized protein LOC123555665 n=1 Tax=Mercenaria mercenaria TaxID=6596 RepID=UPI00234F19DB|nr:uncharacterized protein LOC123555665 [Mercenaria mercenaria]
MMKRRTYLKAFVFMSCCLSFINILVTLQAFRGLENNDKVVDLLISQKLVNALNNGTLNSRNKIESARQHTSETGNANTVRRNNSTKSEIDSVNIEKNNNNTKQIQPENEKKKRYGSMYRPLNFVPNTTHDKSHMVPYLSNDIMKKYLALPESNYTQRVMILTPIRNAERTLDTFKTQLASLSYPHHLLSVYFGESGSTDKTFEKAQMISQDLKSLQNFTDSRVINLKMAGGIHGNDNFRHKKEFQKYRRSFLANARNRLVRYAFKHGGVFDHVLWIDSDVQEFPSDLVQHLLFARSDVVATSCLVKSHEFKGIYDCNSWRETALSLKHQSQMPQDELVLECYAETERIFLPYLKIEGRIVKLDGVGGCALMVKADCFRSGLLFPEVVYKRHIETEGLAKMALDMGYSVVGLPFVEVFHKKRS